MAQLVGMFYSPWTERARWALDHHRVGYRYIEHIVMLGMPELRWRMGRWRGPLTVPALRDGPEVFLDSWEIARHAESGGIGESLFPEASLERIRHYNTRSEELLDAARVLISARLIEDEEAKREALPAFMPGAMRGALSWMASMGIAYIRREFGFGAVKLEDARATLRRIFSDLQKDLRERGDYLVGGKFSYADITMAVTIQALEPPAAETRVGPGQMGPGLRRSWANPELQAEFKDLIEWRDRLYARHRGRT